MSTRLWVGVVLAGLSACGGPQRSSDTAVPIPKIAPAPATRDSAGSTALQSTGETDKLPPSALTDFALATQEVVVAAIDGLPIPSDRLPHARVREQDHSLRSEKPPHSADLDFVAVVMDIEIILVQNEKEGSLRALALLSRTGLKLGRVLVMPSRAPQAVPPWLDGAESFGTQVVAALAQRQSSSVMVGESERAALANDELYGQLTSAPAQVERAERLAALHPQPLGYRFGDVWWAARDRRGTTWGFLLHLGVHDQGLMLDGSPLVQAAKTADDSDELPEGPPPAPPRQAPR